MHVNFSCVRATEYWNVIGKLASVLVIVEVKTRSNERYANADEAVTPQKIRSISIAANSYVKMFGMNREIRFDIITIVGTPEKHEIRHTEDAFLPFI